MGKVFVSYKSEHAGAVRAIVDLLIANGLDVWFAEYEVLAGNYEKFDQQLDAEIAAAIANASHAILFTNRLWDASPYCQRELVLICEQLPAVHILQVCLPREDDPPLDIQKAPELATWDHDATDVTATVRFIVKQMTRDPRPFAAPQPEPKLVTPCRLPDEVGDVRLRCGTVNVGDLRPFPIAPRYGPVGRAHSTCYAGRVRGYKARVDIDYYPAGGAVSERFLAGLGAEAARDDRQLYKELRRRAHRWYRRSEYTPRGLHLLLHDGSAHLGLTHFSLQPVSPQVKVYEWQRFYSLFLRDAATKKPVTVTFTFAVVVPLPDERSSFARFTELVSYFEAIVASFRYKSDPCLKWLPSAGEVWRNRLTGLMTGAVVGWLIYHRFAPPTINHWPLWLAAGALGALLGWLTLGNVLAGSSYGAYTACVLGEGAGATDPLEVQPHGPN